MASRPEARLAQLSAAGWRLLFVLILAFSLDRLLTAQHYLAAVAVILAIALFLLDLWLLLRHRPTVPDGPLDAAVVAAPRELEAALALIDTVTVALFVLDADDRIRSMNRAARDLAGCEAGRLRDLAVLGDRGAAAILQLPIGGRQLIAGEDGRSLLAWTGSIRHPGAAPLRLVSIQSVAGELDAVQVGAWHAMTRVLAHEMMNSLTPISSMAESVEALVAAGDHGPRVTNAVATIVRRSRHLMDFVERYRAIVDLPRPVLADVGIADFLHDIERLVGPDLAKRGIALRVEAPPEFTARFDRALVEQGVINLVKNASDAVTNVADPFIALAGIYEADALVIQVRDNGCGIEEDLLEEIFVPFFTTKSGGAGIGLALAQQIALAHGGGLSASRASGGGSVLKLRLPL